MKKLIIIIPIALLTACGNNAKQQAADAAAAQAKQETIDSVATSNQKQKTIDSLQAVVTADSTAKSETKERKEVIVQQPVATTEVKKKKGWTGTTKGAVIGGGVGAVTGALVSKGKVGGALVGGILGAGAGAGTGAIIDNSKKKKEQKKQ